LIFKNFFLKEMPIPDFQSIFLPLLKFSGDNQEHSSREAVDSLAKFFKLTDEELATLLPSGKQATFANRVNWAKTYLKMAGLLKDIRRGTFAITPQGLEVLKSNPAVMNVRFLKQFPGFAEKHKGNGKRETETSESFTTTAQKSPDEILSDAIGEIRRNLKAEILQNIMNCSPTFFERLVVELLVKMGYGGSIQDAGEVTKQSGDGGIDGIIKEDKLGLDFIYIQAKRWENPVSRPEIQKFAGALMGKQASKGVFITTSKFTNEARDFVRSIQSKIVLVDGEQLAEYMIDHNVGVSVIDSYEIKKVDLDYFSEM
jgi:restriction system protein